MKWGGGDNQKGMPLGNLTSQFFANVYLNELDYFVKHTLKTKYYIRYVDDFVLLHSSKQQLEIWKQEINIFLKNKLKLELHQDKSKIIPLSQGVDFIGFRNFYYFRLLRKRNIKTMKNKLLVFGQQFITEEQTFDEIYASVEGWLSYSRNANTYKLRKKMIQKFEKMFPNELADVQIRRWLKN